ncbi:MAG: universal stress protein [Myxococcota bacterium]
MRPLKTILCPIDFSSGAESAIQAAVQLAGQTNAEVQLLHVYQLPTVALPDGAIIATPDWTAQIMGHAQSALDSLSSRLKERYGRPFANRLRDGVPHLEICRYAEEIDAQLIVIGTHGRTGLSHLLLGSVAERVVRVSKVPVLTVRLSEETDSSGSES